jgi:hypothetical protein
MIPLLLVSSLAQAGEPKLKPVMRGLVAMGTSVNISKPDDRKGKLSMDLDDVFAKPEAFGGVVFNSTWAQLEPQEGRLDTAIIDEQLARIRAYNAAHPAAPLAVRLRIRCGPSAPMWAQKIGGDPVGIVLSQDREVTIGRFWTKEYRAAWRDFQNRLAARYDGEPLIVDVQVTSGMTNTGEPLNVARERTSQQRMREAGFTENIFKEILEQSGEDYAGWATTRLTFVFNPYHKTAQTADAESYETVLMKLYRQKYGMRAILSDHALQFPHVKRRESMNKALVSCGPPLNFQTHAPEGINLPATIADAVAMGADSVEIWNLDEGGFSTMPLGQLLKLKSLFAPNRAH